MPERLLREHGQTKELNQALSGFPFAGLLISIPPAIVWLISSYFLPSLLAAALAIFIGTLITGALHEDGLADCADGLGGGKTVKGALKIMRDSAVGTYGACALIFSFAIRIIALASLEPWLGVLALMMAHSCARAAIVIAIASAEYVRPSGTGDTVRKGAEESAFKSVAIITIALTLLLALISGNIISLLAPVLGFVGAWAFLRYLISRIDGYTGDGLGAMEQIAEITILLVLAGIWA